MRRDDDDVAVLLELANDREERGVGVERRRAAGEIELEPELDRADERKEREPDRGAPPHPLPSARRSLRASQAIAPAAAKNERRPRPRYGGR